LTIATSVEDELSEGPGIKVPEITLEDTTKSKHFPKYGSMVKPRPETNKGT
jgi:hypothetical protein